MLFNNYIIIEILTTKSTLVKALKIKKEKNGEMIW